MKKRRKIGEATFKVLKKPRSNSSHHHHHHKLYTEIEKRKHIEYI